MAVNQLKAGAALNYVVLGLSNLVGLLYTPYMLRMMGQSEYGLYSLVASVIAYLTIMDFGFGNAIIRYTAKFRPKESCRSNTPCLECSLFSTPSSESLHSLSDWDSTSTSTRCLVIR